MATFQGKTLFFCFWFGKVLSLNSRIQEKIFVDGDVDYMKVHQWELLVVYVMKRQAHECKEYAININNGESKGICMDIHRGRIFITRTVNGKTIKSKENMDWESFSKILIFSGFVQGCLVRRYSKPKESFTFELENIVLSFRPESICEVIFLSKSNFNLITVNFQSVFFFFYLQC